MKKIYQKIKSVFFIYILVGISVVNAQTHITTAAELDAMRDDANASYILDNDIDMTSFSWSPFEFYGTLDGNGFSIKNLEVELDNENVGLFSVINGATIKNLGVEDVYIMCTNQGGAIAGVAVNGAIIEKCFATGEVNSGGLTGGFLGRADESTVSESYTEITVNGHDHVGGLVGHMNGGTIVNCYTNSTVYSDAWQVGGLVGWAQNAGASISKSFAKGTVKAESGFTGGILGIADGGEKVVNITECLALQTSLTTVNPDIAKTYRIIAAENAGTFSKNYGLETIEISDPHKVAWKDSVGGKDGGSITAAQVIDAQFYADSLTWDFENVWVMTDEGPELIWAYTPPTSVKQIIPESEARVFSHYGKVWVNGAERDAQIKVYNVNGVLLYQKQNVSTSESFEVKGVAIVLIQTPTRRSVHKVVNF